MLWLYIALLSAALFAITNIVDNYYVNRIFKKKIIPSIFYGHSLKAITASILFFLIAKPKMISLELLPFFIVIGILDFVYLIPYFKALEEDDTSVVSSLFGLERVFIPILAFFFIGEILTGFQYLGIGVVVASSILLTLHQGKGKLRFNKSAYFMLISAFLISIEAILYKHVFNEVDWVTGFTWAFLFIGLSTFGVFLFRRQRKNLVESIPRFKKNIRLIIFGEIISIAGWILVTYAISITEVSLVKAVTASMPFFVLFYAIILEKRFPKIFKENIHRKYLIRKSLLFILLVIGILLLVL